MKELLCLSFMLLLLAYCCTHVHIMQLVPDGT